MFWTTVRKMEGALGAFVTEGRLVDANLPVEIRQALDEMRVSTAPALHCTSTRALRVLRIGSACICSACATGSKCTAHR